MSTTLSLKTSGNQNHKAQLANAYNELGKELSSSKVRVIGNYTLGKAIGEGAYGKVRMGTHRLTSTRVAVKQIPKAMSASLTREIHYHRQLHHPNIAQMYEVIATESSIWIVTELCSGGELFDYLVEKGKLDEDEARIIFGQLCLAVAYLHERNIVHRDLKLENVLLDERCRVKLGDFGFIREYERGILMETFCGTTGYAAPEMLQGKKYIGPEVDVWSLGVILYTLLTGGLPFDDDDEVNMRDKIITAEFDDPEWLSRESRDLIKNILQKDPSRRLSIPQILSHDWFTCIHAVISPESSPVVPPPPQPISPLPNDNQTSDADVFLGDPALNTSPSNVFQSMGEVVSPEAAQNAVVDEGDSLDVQPDAPETDLKKVFPSESPLQNTKNLSSLHPIRTPARTKRRSISSALSDDESPSANRQEIAKSLATQDFASLLKVPAPVIFSTPLERELLNNLSSLGFDAAQIVHSVLSDACDATGALWWMLRRKAEKRATEEENVAATSEKPVDETEKPTDTPHQHNKSNIGKRNAGVQTAQVWGYGDYSPAQSAPQLALEPPTPTVPQAPSTPPLSTSTSLPHLMPSPPLVDAAPRSQPSTPSANMKDILASKIRKPRSGSVSIIQRAATALEAAGIVRKKSVEVVKESKLREKSKETDRKIPGTDEQPRSSHGSSSSKHTKSPPLRAHQEPSSPERIPELQHPQPLNPPSSASASLQPSSSAAPVSSQGIADNPQMFGSGEKKGVATHRTRASLLTTFRLWFNEDRKGKRKEASVGTSRRGEGAPPASTATSSGTMGRRVSGSGANRPASSRKKKSRVQRHSISSRRSSSVNSRRSSANSGNLLALESPHAIYEPRPSAGNLTPNSEKGETSSRPSSIRSLSRPADQKHRKSPSRSSIGSAQFRASSPMHRQHRRAGSATSTNVVRQQRPRHGRSNSATSSVHSAPPSRPTSFYGESSDLEAPRTNSPFRRPSLKRPMEEKGSKGSRGNSSGGIAQRRQTAPFLSLGGGFNYSASSIGRSSWRRSWGQEPPGWQTRSRTTSSLPIEILVISPAGGDGSSNIRDVFSGRTSLSAGDESDWEDEDDDVPAFAGGLGQAASGKPSPSPHAPSPDSPLTASPSPLQLSLPYGRKTKRAGKSGPSEAGGQGRQKSTRGHSPAGRASPILKDGVALEGARRQLPTGRSGPAFRGHAIQEEDEGEEE